MADFYLGVDGGQSSTKALIADASGRIVGRGTGGPCNHVSGPEAREKFRAAVGRCVEEACQQAGLDYASVQFAAACFGFSGGPEDKGIYTLELIRATKFRVCHDAEIALTGATAGRPGIVVIAGTGSIGYGQNSSRKMARTGGWGYIFGDEGSAFDLVRQALRAALRMEEGWGHETPLRTKLLAATDAPTATELMHRFYTPEFPRNRVATFAPLVDETAREGDKVAQTILSFAARDLMGLARGVHHRLFAKHEIVPVCYIGGVFRSELMLENFAREVKSAIGCDVQRPRFSPAAGAVLEALRLNHNESALTTVPESEQ
jgi:N-acetylglucosamine kinase-like BadF-type ATPase